MSRQFKKKNLICLTHAYKYYYNRAMIPAEIKMPRHNNPQKASCLFSISSGGFFKHFG